MLLRTRSVDGRDENGRRERGDFEGRDLPFGCGAGEEGTVNVRVALAEAGEDGDGVGGVGEGGDGSDEILLLTRWVGVRNRGDGAGGRPRR